MLLDPEGWDDHYVYPKGISTSLPAELQLELVRSIEGLEQAEIIVPGYAVEYDHIDPRALASSMLVRGMTGLYCAGQINGKRAEEHTSELTSLMRSTDAVFCWKKQKENNGSKEERKS